MSEFATCKLLLAYRYTHRGTALEAEIVAPKRKLINLRQPFNNVREELLARQKALTVARKSFAADGEGRRKAETLRTVIEKAFATSSTVPAGRASV